MRAVLALLLFVALPLGPATAHSSLPESALADLAFRQHPGDSLPLDAALADEQGAAVRLGEFFTGKPVILVLDYLGCKTLCGLTLDNLAAALDGLPLDAGRDFAVVAVSIDPRDTPAAARDAKARHLSQYHHPGASAGWHFLTGEAASIERIAEAVGFRYRYDPANDQYAHAAGFVIATPDGRIARYVLGVDYPHSDLQRAIGEAGRSQVSSLLSRLLLVCYGYDPQAGPYTLAIERTLMALNLAAVVTMIGLMAVRYHKRHQ